MPSRQEDFAALNQALTYLREGKPVAGKHFGLIRKRQGRFTEQFFQRVVQTTMTGPRGESHSTWLRGYYGGGKTQSLY